MRIAKILGGGVLAVVGVVWMLQGFGASYVPTSFMTKAPEWIFIGIFTAATGLYVALRGVKSSR